jgi:Protein of unknown function (DUF2637)
MNPRTRRTALYAIGIIAILASVDALTHSYAGLYGWAVHHRLDGWQAWSWPAEIDVFVVIGELALYVAYLDAWPGRQQLWPWMTAVLGLIVSVAGNVGHVQPLPGAPVTLADRITAATSPLAAFAGLMIGLLVLKMSHRHAAARPLYPEAPASSCESAGDAIPLGAERGGTVTALSHHAQPTATGLLADAAEIYRAAHAAGESVSQRALATQLRGRGHRFSNDQLRTLAAKVAELDFNSQAA